MSFETVTRCFTLTFTAINVMILLYHWLKYGDTWTAKTLDSAWVLGMWNFVAFIATVDSITGGGYVEARVVLVVLAASLTMMVLFRNYDDVTVQTKPHHLRRRNRRS